jgi:NAD-dependent SIR2 family protein deacetylase
LQPKRKLDKPKLLLSLAHWELASRRRLEMARVIAWHLSVDAARCDQCGQPATVDVVEDNEVTVTSLCNNCLALGTPDPILDVLVRAAEAQREKGQPQRDA